MTMPFSLSREQVRELDRRAIDEFGVPGIVLMENAGRGCAEHLMRLNPERKPTVILCGFGNNGGDGYVIARHLDLRGWPVTLFGIAPPTPPHAQDSLQRKAVHLGFEFDGLAADALINFSIVMAGRLNIFPISSQRPLSAGAQKALSDQVLNRDCWIVDALFGTGLSRALGSPFDELVSIVNAAQRPVLAVDIPSGLDCDTGEPLGPTIRATHTTTFVAHKLGFTNPASRLWTGEIHVADIGAPRVLIDDYQKRFNSPSA